MQDLTKNNFDFIRVLLAFIVFVGHLGALSASPELKIFENSPVEIAVFGFFVVSGFLIARSYERSSGLKSYLKKRIRRIVPAYLLVVFLCAILLSLVSTYSFREYFSNMQVYKYLFWNSIFLNFKAPWLPGVFGNQAVNGALWTLKIEMSYYFCVPLLFLLFGKNNKYRNISLLIIYFLSLVYLNYFELLGKISVAKQLPGTLSYFIPGMLIYFNFDWFIKHKHTLFIIAIFTVWIDLVTNIQFFSPMMIGVIVLYLAYSLKFLNNFGRYGDFTYGIYIFHFPIIRTFTTLGLFKDYNPYLMAVACMLVVIAAGVSSWHFYEKNSYNPFMKELVSIITPSYNSAEFIGETIQSVLNQTYENWEWLISDDRSTDRTVEIIRSYHDPRIKLQVLEQNGGAGNARNKSLERAEGRYIAFLDSDDLWYPEYLETMTGFMRENKAELVYCNYSRCDEHTMEPVLKDFKADTVVTFSNLLKTCRLAPVSTMYDTQRTGKFFFPIKSKREDHVMWLNLLKEIPKGYPLNKTLAKYRMRENSVSRKKKNIIKDQYLVYKEFMGFSTLRSLYYTANWAMNGFLKYSKFFN